MALVLKPNGVNTHDVFLDGVVIAQVRFFRGWHKGRVYHSGHLTNHRTGERLDIGGYAYFADVKRALPGLLDLTA